MKPCYVLLVLGAVPACNRVTVLKEPTPEPHFAVVESAAGSGEIQAADPIEADRYMWRRCPKGFAVVRREEVAVGATSWSTNCNSHNAIDQLMGRDSETTTVTSPINEERTVFRCAASPAGGGVSRSKTNSGDQDAAAHSGDESAVSF